MCVRVCDVCMCKYMYNSYAGPWGLWRPEVYVICLVQSLLHLILLKQGVSLSLKLPDSSSLAGT